MGRMVEVDTSDLTGVALDWAVANYVTGLLLAIPCPPVEALAGYSPSTSWQHGGPLLEQFVLETDFDGAEGGWWSCCSAFVEYENVYEIGQTILGAACRAVVACKAGDTVSVPAELLENA